MCICICRLYKAYANIIAHDKPKNLKEKNFLQDLEGAKVAPKEKGLGKEQLVKMGSKTKSRSRSGTPDLGDIMALRDARRRLKGELQEASAQVAPSLILVDSGLEGLLMGVL